MQMKIRMREKYSQKYSSRIFISLPLLPSHPPFSKKKKSITIFHSINLTNTQSLLNTITLLIIHGSNEIVTRRFVQIAWLKSPAQLFGDLKEILVQRDVDVDYRDEPIIFFSAQIPQFAYARNRICPTSRGFNPTPVSLSIYWNPNSLTRSLLAISYRYDTDIIRILILVFDTGLVCVCIHVSYKLSVKTRTCWHIKFDCIRVEIRWKSILINWLVYYIEIGLFYYFRISIEMFQMIVKILSRGEWTWLVLQDLFFVVFFSLYREWCGGEGLMKSVIYKWKELNFKVIL